MVNSLIPSETQSPPVAKASAVKSPPKKKRKTRAANPMDVLIAGLAKSQEHSGRLVVAQEETNQLLKLLITRVPPP